MQLSYFSGASGFYKITKKQQQLLQQIRKQGLIVHQLQGLFVYRNTGVNHPVITAQIPQISCQQRFKLSFNQGVRPSSSHVFKSTPASFPSSNNRLSKLALTLSVVL